MVERALRKPRPRSGQRPCRSRFEVNGKPVEVEVEPRLTLADCLRHHLRLTGTHVGCEHGVCGACTVLVDGAAVRSCLMLAVQAEGAKVVTVEGLSRDEGLTPLQASFRKHHALQCGFCTPGMITTAHALLSEEPDCDADRVREVLSGNLCRCTGYISIVEAVLDARAAYRRDADGRMSAVNSFIGRPIERLEDLRFVRGRGQFVDDLARPNMLHAAILRSSVGARPHPLHRCLARAENARRACVVTAADLGDPLPRSCRCGCSRCRNSRRSRSRSWRARKYAMSARPIAMVLADSAAIAEDALGAIEVDIEPLPAVCNRAGRGKKRDAAVRGHRQQRRDEIPRRAGRRRRGLQRCALYAARDVSARSATPR